MPLIKGKPRRWRQRRNLQSAISVSHLPNNRHKQSRQTSVVETPIPPRQDRPQPDDDFFDASSSVASCETRINPNRSGDTGCESSGEENAIDNSSFLINLISQYEEDGPVKANRGDRVKKMIQAEEGKWNDFCNKLTMGRLVKNPIADPVDPVELLKTCHPATFKAYLDWRCETSRIKKISSICTHWKVLSMLYSDKCLTWMDDKVLFDIGNWIPAVLAPKHDLDGSRKNKAGLYTGDLDLILHYHWMLDQDVLSHERIRVQIAAALILAGVTATRPGALIQNLYYKNVNFHIFPPVSGSKRARIGMTVTLTKTKRTAGESRPVTYSFHEEDTLLRDPILYMKSLVFADKAFKNQFNDPADIYDLTVPAGQDRIILPWKEEWRDRPIFRDTNGLGGNTTIALDRTFAYAKARQSLINLGRALGYEKQLEWYDLRRGSGKKLNEALTPEERNQSMGHTLGDSSTYVKFYMTDFIEVDFQNIVFGSEPQRDLIQLMGRLMYRADAPKCLTEEQMAEINSDKKLLLLKKRMKQVVEEMRQNGWSLKTAPKEGQGLVLRERHKRFFREIDYLRKSLYDSRLARAINEFHATNDGEEIARQLRGVKPSEYFAPSTIHYELPGRARIARLFSEAAGATNTDERFALRIKLVREIAHICLQREPPRRSRPLPMLPMHEIQDDSLAPAYAQSTRLQTNAPSRSRQTAVRSTARRLACPFCDYKLRTSHKCKGRPDQLPVLCPYGYETCGGILGTFEHFISHVQRQHPMYLSEM